MKKQKFKLGLHKSIVSNLNNLEAIKGGDPTYSVELFCIASFTVAIGICCDTNGGTGGETEGALCGATGGAICGNTVGSFCGYETYEVFGCRGDL